MNMPTNATSSVEKKSLLLVNVGESTSHPLIPGWDLRPISIKAINLCFCTPKDPGFNYHPLRMIPFPQLLSQLWRASTDNST